MRKKDIRQQDGTLAWAYDLPEGVTLDERLVLASQCVGRPVLLGGSVLRRPGGGCTLSFPVTGQALSERLGRPLSGGEARALLASVADLVDEAVTQRMPLLNVRFGADEVEVRADGRVRFVFLPVRGLIPDLDALRRLLAGVVAQARAGDEDAKGVLASVGSLLEQDGPLDAVTLSARLRRVAEGTGAACIPGAAEPQAARRAGADEGACRFRPDARPTTMLASGGKGEPGGLGREESPLPPPAQGPVPGQRPDDKGTVVLGGLDDDLLAGLSVGPQATPPRQDRTGVLDLPGERRGSGCEGGTAERQSAGQQPAVPAPPASGVAGTATVGADAATVVLASGGPSDAPGTPAVRCHLTRLSTGERFEVCGRRFVVGKSKYSSFQVRGSTTVSRSHAILSVVGGACTIMDDSSRNGTFLNGERLVPGFAYELLDGDVVRLSDERFAVEVGPA